MNLSFRKVSLSDSSMLLKWRNDPEVYRYFFSAGPVSENSHEKWMEKIASSNETLFLIGMNNEIPIGTVRFDFNSNFTEAEVGIYLASDFHGKGLGGEMLSKAEFEAKKYHPSLEKIIAKVMIDNIASEKMFEKVGYKKHFIQLEKKLGN